MHMMCGGQRSGMHEMGMQSQMPMVPAPMAFFGMFVAFMFGMMLGAKKSMAMRGMGMGMGHGGKMMGMHHHHGYGAQPCGCGQAAQAEQDREQDRPEGGG